MGTFKGYFDESGEDEAPHNAVAFCGYVGTLDSWRNFESEWERALAENQAPYLRMKELQNPRGPLARFAGKENQVHCAKLLGDLIGVIARSGLTCAGSLIRLPDLKEFNAEYRMNLEALPLAIYATMGELYQLYPDDTLELIADRLDEPEKTFATAVEYSKSYVFYDASEKVRWSSLKGEHTFRNIRPIQAADFVAWEARKEHERKDGWWRHHKRGLAAENWHISEGMWLGRQGKPWPNHRRSFFELASAAEIHAGVIDYDFLCKHHREIRRGVWTKEGRLNWWKSLWAEQSS